jgi:hypothetical protein
VCEVIKRHIPCKKKKKKKRERERERESVCERPTRLKLKYGGGGVLLSFFTLQGMSLLGKGTLSVCVFSFVPGDKQPKEEEERYRGSGHAKPRRYGVLQRLRSRQAKKNGTSDKKEIWIERERERPPKHPSMIEISNRKRARMP